MKNLSKFSRQDEYKLSNIWQISLQEPQAVRITTILERMQIMELQRSLIYAT